MSQFLPKLEKTRPATNPSLFTTSIEPFFVDKPAKSPRSFEDGGVGLGIVAAMTASSQETPKVATLSVFPTSNPISIGYLAKPAANFKGDIGLLNLDRIVDESDESYTCVISHVGNNVIEMLVYYGFDNSIGVYDVSPGLFYASSSPTMVTMNVDVGCGGSEERRDFWTSDFLTSCCLCNKPLHGLDIFLYRDEKAFCGIGPKLRLQRQMWF
uniref:FLZ-type domain-containing protein n=1 Tax=Rhizophora mucronata TaxID=61149 RepID=A0A2P2P4E0_RHIMU